MRLISRCLLGGVLVLAATSRAATEADWKVDFRYAPPEWQTAICLPDDPAKSLVDKSGALLYHYKQEGREFGTQIVVEVSDDAAWQKQELYSPRVPIVKTYRAGPGLNIVEEAFAVTSLPPSKSAPPVLQRVDDGTVNKNWATPPADLDPSLQHIAVHFDGSIQYKVGGGLRRIALALCEGWWGEEGKRVQVLKVEGAETRMVDTVKDIGKNKAAVFWFDGKDMNGDGLIEVTVEAAPAAADKNTVLNGLWVFPADVPRDDRALLTGKLKARAIARLESATPGGPARNDVILVHVTNTGNSERTVQPRLIVDTKLDFQFEGQRVVVGGHETITASLKMTGLMHDKAPRRVVQLEPLTLPARKTVAFFVLNSDGGSMVIDPTTVKQALTRRDEALAYWETKAPLPYGRIEVPDARIQALLDSSIRNIWQAREIRNGLPAFQVGPTCYRGLWIVDGAFLLEAATILGAGDQARNGVAYELTHQKPDGAIEVMGNYWKENGIVLWTCVRHAQLTQDKAWLESIWPKLTRVAEFMKVLRQQALQNDSPLDDGLIPPGFPDGGISGMQYEYTNVYWNLLGLRAFVHAAQWLGHTAEAAQWQKEYDDFMAAFRKAAARDMKTDPHGNRYLPIRMDGQDLPQRAQWGFCHGVYPGQLFDRADPLVAGNMAMLEATEREGMVYGTGWDATGIWNYFASFYGHAWLWQGNGRKAAEILYAYANHAAPVLDWREEQSLKGENYKKVGDMPHNWASAEFIRLAVHLLALDRGDELHLCEGLPAEWTKPGMITKLDGIATPFGPLMMELRVAKDGRSARVHVEPPRRTPAKRVVLHLGTWARPDDLQATLELSPSAATTKTISLRTN